MYKNIIFDLYGTLVSIKTNESKHWLWKNMSAFYTYSGCRYTSAELKKAYMHEVKKLQQKCESNFPEIDIGEVFAQLYVKKGTQPSKECIELTARAFRILSTNFINVYNGVPQLLNSLHKSGKNIYLLTNAQRLFTVPELQALSLYDKFDGMVISSDIGCCKPDSNIFKFLIQKYNLNTEECVMIGNDADCDIAGANSVGIKSIYVKSELSTEKVPKYAQHSIAVNDILSIQYLI